MQVNHILRSNYNPNGLSLAEAKQVDDFRKAVNELRSNWNPNGLTLDRIPSDVKFGGGG